MLVESRLYPTVRLILFDIDGTLVLTGGAGQRAMNRAFEQLHAVPRVLEGVALAGRTDRAILADAIARVPHPVSLDQEWLVEFATLYCELLEQEMRAGAADGKFVLPGVRPLLDALVARDDVSIGLLTGNIAPAARIKLEYFGLWEYFAWGAFGDLHRDRNALFGLALDAARRHDGTRVEHDRVLVIGDTPHDVTCARSGGAVAIAVATGFSSIDQLRAAGADVVFEDLSDTAAVIDVLTAG